MKIGTKSVLFGAHFFLTHWLFVARGWYKLYGTRSIKIGEVSIMATHITPDGNGVVNLHHRIYASIWDPRLWVAFLIHDLGYVGKPNMDGEEGETHPEWAAKKMTQWFGTPWGDLCRYHSRFYAKLHNRPVSALCYADKLAICMEPWWYYLPRVIATGEIQEYMRMAQRKEASKGYTPALQSRKAWYLGIQEYMTRWIEEHKDGREDTWTKGTNYAERSRGGYQ